MGGARDRPHEGGRESDDVVGDFARQVGDEGPSLAPGQKRRLIAAVDLIGRTGAREFQLGHLEEDVPIPLARWYAHAQYQGARITVDEQADPIVAVEGLAARLVNGGMCTHCGARTVLDRAGSIPRGPYCAYRLVGDRYMRGCAARTANRAARRKARR